MKRKTDFERAAKIVEDLNEKGIILVTVLDSSAAMDAVYNVIRVKTKRKRSAK